MTRFVILASGHGTNAEAVMDACRDGRIDGEVVLVVTNLGSAGVIAKAAAAGVPVEVLPPRPGEQRSDYDRRLSSLVRSHGPDVVVLAGWMRLLSMGFLGTVGTPVVNLHPALPGEFPGVKAIERAFAEREMGRTRSGVMVHLVPDEGVDCGPLLAQASVPILPTDSLEGFTDRIHREERRLLVDVLASMSGRTGPAREQIQHD